MTKLAIKGHPTRGKEVIEILEMFGGKNTNYCNGQFINSIYFINKYGYIESTSNNIQKLNYNIYSLEEFQEKYPYKVGDLIEHKSIKHIDRIKSMKYTKDIVIYVTTNDYYLLTKDISLIDENYNQTKKETINLLFDIVNIVYNCKLIPCTQEQYNNINKLLENLR